MNLYTGNKSWASCGLQNGNQALFLTGAILISIL